MADSNPEAEPAEQPSHSMEAEAPAEETKTKSRSASPDPAPAGGANLTPNASNTVETEVTRVPSTGVVDPQPTPTPTPMVKHSRDQILMAELRQELEKTKVEMEHLRARHADEIAELRRSMAAEVKNSVDRSLKRTDSVASAQNREKERQIVAQSTEIAKLKKEVAALKTEIEQRDSKLMDEQRRSHLAAGEKIDQSAQSEVLQRQFAAELRSKQSELDEANAKISSLVSKEASNLASIARLESKIAALTVEHTHLKANYEVLRTAQGSGSGSGATSVQPATDSTKKASSEGSTPTASSQQERSTASPVEPQTATTVADAPSAPPTGSVVHRDPTPQQPVVGSPPASLDRTSSSGSLVQSASISQPGAASSSSSSSSSRDMQRLESMLRAKDKQIVTQGSEMARLKGELERLSASSRRMESETSAAKESLELEKQVVHRLKSEAADSLNLINTLTAELTDLRSRCTAQQRELSELTATKDALNSKKVSLEAALEESQRFKAAHVSCDQKIAEQDQKILSFNSQILSLEDEIKQNQNAYSDLEKKAAETKQALTQKDELFNAMAEQKNAQIKALLQEGLGKDQTMAELRKTLDIRGEELITVSKRFTATQGGLEAEILSLKKQLTESHELQAQLESAVKKSGGEAVERCQSLQLELARLREDYSASEQARRQLEAKVQAANAEATEKRTAIQKVSLELEESKQKYSKLEKALERKCEEVNQLIDQINEMEGNNTGSTNTTKRLIGMIESFSVEICQRLSDVLQTEYMKGAPRAIAFLVEAFHIDRELATDAVDVLCKCYFYLKHCDASVAVISKEIGIPDASLKRIVSAFRTVLPKYQPSERRQVLLQGSPPEAKELFGGQDRLMFLLCAKATSTANGNPLSQSSGIGRLYDPNDIQSKAILSLICSFLTPVIKGGANFATHEMIQHRDGSREGHTVFIAMLDRNSFVLMECQVTPQQALLAVISGSYRRSSNQTSTRSVKYNFQCASKKDAVCQLVPQASPNLPPKTVWKWSPDEEIPPSESTILQYSLEWDRRHDGLQLVDVHSETKVGLRELSGEEVAWIQELYGGEMDLSAMMNHKSWKSIPPPSTR
jgi:hypothetical protein